MLKSQSSKTLKSFAQNLEVNLRDFGQNRQNLKVVKSLYHRCSSKSQSRKNLKCFGQNLEGFAQNLNKGFGRHVKDFDQSMVGQNLEGFG